MQQAKDQYPSIFDLFTKLHDNIVEDDSFENFKHLIEQRVQSFDGKGLFIITPNFLVTEDKGSYVVKGYHDSLSEGLFLEKIEILTQAISAKEKNGEDTSGLKKKLEILNNFNKEQLSLAEILTQAISAKEKNGEDTSGLKKKLEILNNINKEIEAKVKSEMETATLNFIAYCRKVSSEIFDKVNNKESLGQLFADFDFYSEYDNDNFKKIEYVIQSKKHKDDPICKAYGAVLNAFIVNGGREFLTQIAQNFSLAYTNVNDLLFTELTKDINKKKYEQFLDEKFHSVIYFITQFDGHRKYSDRKTNLRANQQLESLSEKFDTTPQQLIDKLLEISTKKVELLSEELNKMPLYKKRKYCKDEIFYLKTAGIYLQEKKVEQLQSLQPSSKNSNKNGPVKNKQGKALQQQTVQEEEKDGEPAKKNLSTSNKNTEVLHNQLGQKEQEGEVSVQLPELYDEEVKSSINNQQISDDENIANTRVDDKGKSDQSVGSNKNQYVLF
jgi:hypothetical protein